MREALARAIGDPTLELALWLPSGRRGWMSRANCRPAARRGTARDLLGERLAVDRPRPGSARSARAARGGRLGRPACVGERAFAGGAARPAGRATRVTGAHRPCRRRGAPPARARSPRRRPTAAARPRHGPPAPPHVDATTAAASCSTRPRTSCRRALRELRELARGIHPAVLTDQGLDAALRTLAERAPLPCRGRRRPTGASPQRWRQPPTSSSPKHSPTSPKYAHANEGLDPRRPQQRPRPGRGARRRHRRRRPRRHRPPWSRRPRRRPRRRAHIDSPPATAPDHTPRSHARRDRRRHRA